MRVFVEVKSIPYIFLSKTSFLFMFSGIKDEIFYQQEWNLKDLTVTLRVSYNKAVFKASVISV